MKRHKFAPAEVCALRVDAFGEYFDVRSLPQPYEKHGDVLVVNVRGPLMHHESWCCDSYDSIKLRVQAALEQKPKAIILSIDSPGGLVSGCFDTSREVAACCEAAGVPLYSYVDGCACSAAYALACVAERIFIPEAAEAGSIGCIAEVVSTAKLDAAMGIDRQIITSGARKADGNPGQPITDDAKAAISEKVTRMAGLFADHVAAHRPISIANVLGLQAAIFVGEDAVSKGLADDVMGLDEMLAAIAADKFAEATTPTAPETKTMKTKATSAASAEDDKKNPFAAAQAAYKASLQAVADDKDASDEDKDKAKKALAAMGDDDSKASASADDKDSSAPPPPPKKDSEESKATASALGELRAFLDGQKTKAAEDETARVKAEAEEKTKLIAGRPDLAATVRTLLASSSLADVKVFIEKHPRSKPKHAATAATLSTTRTATQGTTADAVAVVAGAEPVPMAQDDRKARLMRIAMGTEKADTSVFQRGPQLVIGAMPEHIAIGESEDDEE